MGQLDRFRGLSRCVWTPPVGCKALIGARRAIQISGLIRATVGERSAEVFVRLRASFATDYEKDASQVRASCGANVR